MTGARPDTWMPFYVGDYLRDTMHFSVGEHGAYILIILAYWTNSGPLADDDAQLAAISRMTPRQWDAARRVIAPKFDIADGLWTHGRIDRELATAISLTAERSKAGSNGAAKRWQTHGKRMAKPKQNDAPSPSQDSLAKEDANESKSARAAPRPKIDLATWQFDAKAIQICLDANADSRSTNDHINDWGANAVSSKRYRTDPHAFVRNWFRSDLRKSPATNGHARPKRGGTAEIIAGIAGAFSDCLDGGGDGADADQPEAPSRATG